MDDYYSRKSSLNTDGTPLFQADHDKKHESSLQKIVNEEWKCTLHHFGQLCPVDFYAVKHGRMVGLVELKTRTHRHDRYPDVFLNLRKWFCLCLGESCLGCPSVFVVKFIDVIKWVRVTSIDRPNVVISGCRTQVKSNTDIEPVIKVPVGDMTPLRWLDL